MNKKAMGNAAEDTGAAWLESMGMRILERNYRCRVGEIDIIGLMDGMLVMVEVRSRSSADRGSPAESVNYRKKLKLRQVATWYLCKNNKADNACRFDVLSLLYNKNKTSVQIEWIRNAF